MNQRGGFPALTDWTWGGSYGIAQYKKNYWMTYIGGHGTGYEAVREPLHIGLAWTRGDVASSHEWQSADTPLLSIDDKDAQWWEKLTQYKSTVYELNSEKWKGVLPKELPPTMALQSMSTDKNYFFFYAKLRDRRSRLQEQTGYDRIFTYQGIYLDLFVLEPMTKPLHWLSNRTFGIIYKVLRNPEYNTQQLIRKTDSIYRVNMRFVFPLLRLLSRLFSPRLLTYSPGIPFESQRDPAELFPLSIVVFEGHRFSAPHNPEAYLRRMFGNWQRLPDIDKISTHTARLEFT